MSAEMMSLFGEKENLPTREELSQFTGKNSPILQDDHPDLRQISEPVTVFDMGLKDLVKKMFFIMLANNGRGLSAVQIGIHQRVIIAFADGEFLIMVNPVFVRKLNRETIEFEGCLSLPRHKWRQVSRPVKCEITWQDLEGNIHQNGFEGEPARVLQHEIDHLDGILITDKPMILSA